jgi:hypothetical protein
MLSVLMSNYPEDCHVDREQLSCLQLLEMKTVDAVATHRCEPSSIIVKQLKANDKS